MITKAVIPAAGLGTRFLPATKAQPKEMLPVGDAVYYAKSFVGDEAFALLLGDTITVPGCTKELIKKYEEFKFKTSIIAVEKVPKEKISSYGIIRGKRS